MDVVLTGHFNDQSSQWCHFTSTVLKSSFPLFTSDQVLGNVSVMNYSLIEYSNGILSATSILQLTRGHSQWQDPNN